MLVPEAAAVIIDGLPSTSVAQARLNPLSRDRISLDGPAIRNAIRVNRFARIDSQKTPIFITCERFARILSNLGFASFSPTKRDSQKKGVQFGNRSPETIRENQAIRANLRIDSRESANRFARISPSKRRSNARVTLCFSGHRKLQGNFTHPNKPPTQIETVCTNSLRKLFWLFSACLKRSGRTVCTNCPEIVRLQTVLLFGWVFFWGGSPLRENYQLLYRPEN